MTIIEKSPRKSWTVRVAYQRSRPPSPGRATDRAATSGRTPSSCPADPDLDPVPSTLAPATGRADRRGRDDALDDGAAGRNDAHERLRRDERQRPAGRSGSDADAYGSGATSVSVRYCDTPQESSRSRSAFLRARVGLPRMTA